MASLRLVPEPGILIVARREFSVSLIKRENRDLRLENAFLKKTAAYFARDERGGSR